MRRSSVGLVALAAAALTFAGAAAGAQDGNGATRLQYVSSDDANPRLRIFVTGERRGATVDLGIDVECGGFELHGRFDARVLKGERIRVEGALTGGGTDTYEMELDLSGRLRSDRIGGTATVEGRAFDEEGETGTCDEEYEWIARRARSPRLGDVQAQVPVPEADDDVLLVTGGDAVYAVHTEPAAVYAVAPDTDDLAWSAEIDGAVDAAVATEHALWLLDGVSGDVRRFDLESREIDETLDVGARDPQAPYPHETAVVAVGDDVWAVAGTGQQLVEIDGETATIGRTLDLGGSLDSIASDGDALYVNVVAVEPGTDRTGDEPVALRRIDPETLDTVAEVDSDVSVELAVDAETLWSHELLETVQRDPRTLAADNRVETSAFDLVAAPPGAWLVDDGLTIVDDTPEIVEQVPPFGARFGSITAGFDSVWVWDDEGSVVLRFATGERES